MAFCQLCGQRGGEHTDICPRFRGRRETREPERARLHGQIVTPAQAAMSEFDQHLRGDGWVLINANLGDRTYERHDTVIVLRGLQGDRFRADSYVRLRGQTDLRKDELPTGYTGPEPTPAAFFGISVGTNGFDVEEQVGDEATGRVTKHKHSCAAMLDLYRLVSSRSDAVVEEKTAAS